MKCIHKISDACWDENLLDYIRYNVAVLCELNDDGPAAASCPSPAVPTAVTAAACRLDFTAVARSVLLHLHSFYGVCWRSAENLCLLFMTGNAHHKSLVSTLFSAGNRSRGMAEGRCRDPAQTRALINRRSCAQSERRQKGMTETRSRAPEGFQPRQRPLAPAHASLHTGVGL